MHEMSVIDSLMGILTREAERAGVARVTSVAMQVGVLRGLDARQLRGCFELFAEGTVVEGARLEIEEITIEGRCRHCAHVWMVERYRLRCPQCGGGDVETLRGRELRIVSFDGCSATAGPDLASVRPGIG